MSRITLSVLAAQKKERTNSLGYWEGILNKRKKSSKQEEKKGPSSLQGRRSVS